MSRSGDTRPLDFAATLDAFPDAVVASDPSGCVIYANRAAERLLGWDEGELLGRPLTSLMPERMRALHLAGKARWHRTHEPHIMGRPWRVPALTKDGNEIEIDLVLGSLAEAPDLVVASLRDMRQRQELERQLEAGKFATVQFEVMRLLASAASLEEVGSALLCEVGTRLGWQVGVLWRATPEGLRSFATWSDDSVEVAEFLRACEARVFAPGDGIPGRVWANRDAMWSTEIESEGDYLQRGTASVEGLRSVVGVPLAHAGGVIGVLELLSRAPRAPGPEMLRALGTLGGQIAQFTARMDAERALRERRAFLDATLQGLGEGVVTVDLDGRITSLNAAAESLLGLASDEAVGRPLTERLNLITERSRERIGDWAQRVDGAGMPETARVVTREGRETPVELSVTRMRAPASGLVLVLRDIGQRRRAERERARLLGEAVEAVRVRDTFLTVAAHELRTPLTGLRLRLQTLLLHAEGGQKERLASLERQLHRLEMLVEEMLEVSRLSERGVTLDLRPTDLREVTEDVIDLLADALLRAGCTVEVRGPSVVGHWDRSRLERVITNLVSNAMKYGAGAPIEIDVSRRDGWALLRVRDHGIGISREAQGRLFQRFSRQVSERHYGGLGMGLWIAKAIVEALGGEITVQSEPNRGATFTVRLPLRGPRPRPPRPSSRRPREGSSPSALP